MSDGAVAPQEAAPEASPAPESSPEAGESPQAEDTAPTPVREGLGAKHEGKEGLDGVAQRFRDKYGIGGEEEPAEPESAEPESGEPPSEEAGDGVPTPPEDRSTADAPEGTYRDAQGRLKDAQTHRYVSESTDAGEQPASPEDGMEATAGEATELPEGFESVELPGSHPLRERGLTHVTLPGPEVVGKEQYEALRSGLNNPVRHRDVSQAEERATEAEQRAAELEARVEIMQSPDYRRLDPEQNPELRDQIEDHRRAYGDEAAELLEESLEARREKLLEQGTEQARSQAEWTRIAQRFTRSVGANAKEVFPVWAESGELRQYLPRLVAEYSNLVDAGQAAPDPQQFFEWAWWRYYGRDPRVQSQAQEEGPGQQAAGDSQKTREELKEEIRAEVLEELKEEEAERLKDAATRRQRSTPGRLPSADAGVRTPVGAEGEGPDLEGKSPDQVKRAAKQSLLDKFRS